MVLYTITFLNLQPIKNFLSYYTKFKKPISNNTKLSSNMIKKIQALKTRRLLYKNIIINKPIQEYPFDIHLKEFKMAIISISKEKPNGL